MKSKAELVLDYIKAFQWPLLALVIVWLFYPQLSSLLGGATEVDVFGFKIKGEGAAELKEAEQTLTQANNELAHLLNGQLALNDELLAKNLALEQALEQQRHQMQQMNPTRPLPSRPAEIAQQELQQLADKSEELSGAIRSNLEKTQQIVQKDKYEQAQQLEAKGFTHLANGRFHEALTEFDAAYKIFPTYRNVDEISGLLRRKMDAFDNPATREQTRREVYEEIIKKYAWGMPADIRTELTAYLRRTN